MPWTDVSGLSVFYRAVGDEGLPPLVLVHGLYGDGSAMMSIAERFADRFHVIVPDVLGHGRTARPAAFTIEDQGAMLCGLVATLRHRHAAIVGISMGAYLAAQAAIVAPGVWTGLVLVVGKAHGRISSSAAYAERHGFDLAAATPEEIAAFMDSAVWSRATPQDRRDAVSAEQAEETVALTPEEREAVEASLAGFDLRPQLPTVTIPTLVLSGREDGLNPPAAGEELARAIPGARFEVYENAGHMLPYEQADRFVAEVAAFLAT